jgi:phage shock protein C
MSLAHELERLQRLHTQGALNDAEFMQAKKRLLEGDASMADATQSRASDTGAPRREPSILHQLARSKDDRWIGGVCGGLAEFSNIPTWSWRLLFVLLLLLHGLGLLVYLLMWIFVPLAKPRLVLLPEKMPEYPPATSRRVDDANSERDDNPKP